MNIAIFTDTYFPCINGVTSSVYVLSKELRRCGHNVYVFTVSDPNSTTKQTSVGSRIRRYDEEVIVYRLPSIPISFLKPNRIAMPFSLRVYRITKKLQIDVIHTQTEFAMGLLGKSISTSLKIPIVHTYHTMYEDYTHYIAKGLITPDMARSFSKRFCNMTNTVIVPTEKTADHLIKYGVKRPIYIIPTGIDLTPFMKDNYSAESTQELKKKSGIDPTWPIILCLGRIAQEKSIDVMIKQMPNLLKILPEARLVIVGDGPARVNLQQLAKSLEISDHVLFLGAVPYKTIGSYYQLGDVFVCCSETETQGLTYYEAMAAGIPIVARRDDCIKLVIMDGKQGRLFDSSTELPELLKEVLTNKSIAEKYAKNAYSSVLPYSAGIFGERVEDVYAHTIDSQRVQKAYKKDGMFKIPTPDDLRSGALRLSKLEMTSLEQRRKRLRKIKTEQQEK